MDEIIGRATSVEKVPGLEQVRLSGIESEVEERENSLPSSKGGPLLRKGRIFLGVGMVVFLILACDIDPIDPTPTGGVENISPTQTTELVEPPPTSALATSTPRPTGGGGPPRSKPPSVPGGPRPTKPPSVPGGPRPTKSPSAPQ
jgi:hypothetical protein